MASSKAGHGGVPQKAPGPPGFPAVNSFTNAEYMIAFPFGLVALALLFATANLTNKQPFLKNLAFAEKIWVRNDAAARGAFRKEFYGLRDLGPNTPRLRTLHPWPGTL